MSNEPSFSASRRFAAWSVHFYTALGLPLMYLAATELFVNHGTASKDPTWFFIWIWIAVFVDGTDGMMARAVEVKRVLPYFSGRRLDDIVDFLSFAFLPCIAFGVFGLFPPGWEWFATVPIMASGYGFCQEKAKTDDAFVGFPSYWNIVLLYLFLFELNPWVNLAIVGILAVMVFVPIHYIYPTRTQLFRGITMITCTFWGVSLLVLSIWSNETWTPMLVWASLTFPVYYLILSVVHHTRVHRSVSA